MSFDAENFWWNDEHLELDKIGKRLETLKNSDSEEATKVPRVILAGHKNAPYGVSIMLKQIMQEHGITEIYELTRIRNGGE